MIVCNKLNDYLTNSLNRKPTLCSNNLPLYNGNPFLDLPIWAKV